MTYAIMVRSKVFVNTDPMKRCYNGCFYSYEYVWGDWKILNYDVAEEDAEDKLKFWRELNDYAVSQRGESAKSEFKLEMIQNDE